MSIRFRLTLLYSVVLAITLVLFGGVLYLRLDRNLHAEIDQTLNDRAGRELRLLSGGRTNGRTAGRDFDPGGGAALGDPAIFQEVRGANGLVCFSPPNQAPDTLPQPASTDRTHFEFATVNHVHLRVLVRPLENDVSGRAVLSACTPPATELLARSLTDVDNTLARLQFFLLLGTAVSLAVAGAAGYLLARKALQPIDRLTAEAAGIGHRQDFKRRIQHGGPNDEVGRLATTFNEMLDGLDAAHERLRVAFESQRRFVADASHELRTPLTTIRGNVDLLRLDDQDASPDQREALSDIATEAERMSRLVNNLLALARADSGVHIARRPIDVQAVVAEVFQKASRRADHVDLRLGETANVTVFGDRDYLVQLLFILVDNALKYTPAGGIVTLSTSCAGDMLRLAVRDTGVGIAPADQVRVFDRFYRSDPSRYGEGTGLGLAIARWIAGEFDGSIEVKSAPGEGSTFTLVLPAIAGPPSEDLPIAAAGAHG